MDYSFVAESKHAWRVKTKRKAFVATEIYCHSGCLTVGKCVCVDAWDRFQASLVQ
jgi:hypothetical protein